MGGSCTTKVMNDSLADEEFEQFSNKTYEEISVVSLSERDDEKPTNAFVLNVAFLSFLVFTIIQFFFSITAKSQSMMTDCAAMMVDVVTYLFNYCAEVMKTTDKSTESERDVKIRNLYMELVPPLLSVTTLIVVTVMSLTDAFRELLLNPVNDSQNTFASPDLHIMLTFSSMNLVLDIVNVTCFARVHQAIGTFNDLQRKENCHTSSKDDSVVYESSPLLRSNESIHKNDRSASNSANEDRELNLNMCSAWTHVCADTLRSIAVLVGAGSAWVFPELVTPEQADSGAAIFVSLIILISLVPLIQALFVTAQQIYVVWSCYDNKAFDDDVPVDI